MIDPDGLNVWSAPGLVGYLWRNPAGSIGFRYDPRWIAQGGFAVSHALPLHGGDFSPEDSIAHRFFANLLPEGGVREKIVRDLKIPNTDFDLLRAIGGECAGAISLLPVGQQPSTKYQYHPLTDDELARLAALRGQVHIWSSTQRPRLSLAGAQDKCPILVRDGAFLLPMQESPSSHILKFEPGEYRHLPAYETYTTFLAKAAGLPVVDIQLRLTGKTRYALITRYDRLRDNTGAMQRLHQEDFCQALGYGHERKYQEDGGPSFAECYQLVRDISSNPAIDLQNLLRWQIFNVLAGNSDGHAKNLSLLYLANGEIRLAPFYDLVCTRAIERIDYHLAFSVGDERNPGMITRKNWEELANQCDIRPQFLLNQVDEAASRLLDNLDSTKTAFESQFGAYPALQRIRQVVTKQCQKVGIR